jgi:hypothetical protein
MKKKEWGICEHINGELTNYTSYSRTGKLKPQKMNEQE